MDPPEGMLKQMSQSSRPLITFALMAYNQEQLIEEAVAGALAQTYSPLEIILSDDCSTDRTFSIMSTMVEGYAGPHRVRLNRNPNNLGLIGHINALFDMAKGEIFVLAAGDDISLPERTARVAEVFERKQTVMMVHSDVIKLNRAGQELGVWRPPIAGKPDDLHAMAAGFGIHIGATGAYRMQVHRRFGAIREDEAYEDLVLGFRARLLGKVAYIESPLVRYRFDTGLSSKQKPLERHVRTRNRIRSLRLMRAVHRQRLADYRAVGGADSGVVSAIEAGIRDAEDRLSFHEGGFWRRLQVGGYLPDLIATAADEARRAWLGDLKSFYRRTLRNRAKGGENVGL